jgi:hypothetical protein
MTLFGEGSMRGQRSDGTWFTLRELGADNAEVRAADRALASASRSSSVLLARSVAARRG